MFLPEDAYHAGFFKGLLLTLSKSPSGRENRNARNSCSPTRAGTMGVLLVREKFHPPKSMHAKDIIAYRENQTRF
jgi:hypothetical protein